MQNKILVSLIVFSLFFTFLTPPVHAIDFNNVVDEVRSSFRSVLGVAKTMSFRDENREENREEREGIKSEIEKRKEDIKEVAEAEREIESSRGGKIRELRIQTASKTAEIKQEICEKRRELSKKRSEQTDEMSQKTIEVFSKIALRVEEYYTAKLVPAGKILPNYDALVADIATKKAALLSAIESAKSEVTTVDCSKGEARNDISIFKTNATKVRNALQDYRKSINNLLVAVRSLSGKLEAEKPKVSVTPTPNAVVTVTPTP